MENESQYEDNQMSPWRCIHTWNTEEKNIWELEVRERIGAVSLRLGQVIIKGALTGELTLSIEDMGFRL